MTFKKANPEKAKYCPKCLESEHSFKKCKAKVGKYWEKTEAKAKSTPSCSTSTSMVASNLNQDKEPGEVFLNNEAPRNLEDLDPWTEAPNARIRNIEMRREQDQRRREQTQRPVLQQAARTPYL